jgi:intracellular septation protein
MGPLFEFIPVFLFFGVYFVAERMPERAHDLVSGLLSHLGLGADVPADQGPILLATVGVIVATIGQVVFLVARRMQVPKMLWANLAIIVVLGGLTLALRDATFIKWKPTVLYWVFAGVLLITERLFGRNLVRQMMGAQLPIPEPLWVRVNLAVVGFFVAMGCINLWVAYTFSQDTWVTFKLFGGMGLMFVFFLGLGLWLSKHVEEERPEEP